MCAASALRPPLAPIFVIVDDDREALDRLMVLLDSERYYIPISETRRIVRYAVQFSATAIFMADDLAFPEGGAARLLQVLLDRVGKPVIIMSDGWTPEVAERWKRMGAEDCIPHPTRIERRMDGFRKKVQDLAVWALAPGGGAEATEGRKDAGVADRGGPHGSDGRATR